MPEPVPRGTCPSSEQAHSLPAASLKWWKDGEDHRSWGPLPLPRPHLRGPQRPPACSTPLSPTPSPLVSFLYIQGTQQHRAYFACVFNCRSVSNQSILKEINPECSLEVLMLKLKLKYFGHLIRRADSLKWTLMLGEIEGLEEKGTTEDEMAG